MNYIKRKLKILTRKPTNISNIPSILIFEISTYLNDKDLLSFMLVSKRFFEIKKINNLTISYFNQRKNDAYDPIKKLEKLENILKKLCYSKDIFKPIYDLGLYKSQDTVEKLQSDLEKIKVLNDTDMEIYLKIYFVLSKIFKIKKISHRDYLIYIYACQWIEKFGYKKCEVDGVELFKFWG